MLDLAAQQFALGIEPLALLRGSMELTHKITVAQLGTADYVSAEEREAIEGWARTLSAGQLHRLWQLLLKGFEEVRLAPDPLVAAQMALLRVMHAADMPDPGQLAKQLEELASRPAPAAGLGGAASEAPQARAAPQWQALVEAVERGGQLRVGQIMRDWVRVASLSTGELLFTLAPGYSGDPSAELRDALLKATGERWRVERVEAEGAPSLRELAEAAKAGEAEALRRDPLVEAAFAAFPDARICR